MFRNLRKKTKRKLNWKKKAIFFFSNCPNFVIALYTLISLNLHIILKKKLHIQVHLKEAHQCKNSKNFGYKSKKWDLD